MDQFFIVANQLGQFFIMLLIGYVSARTKVVDEGFLTGLSKLIMRVILPILIFSNTVSGATRESLLQSLPVFFLAIGMYAGLLALFKVLAGILGLKGEMNKVFRALMIFGNVGFIGIPIISAMFPEKGMIYIALITIVDQSVLWIYGVRLTTPESQQMKINFKNFINPALCAVALAVATLLAGIKLPEVILPSLSTVGKSATPLSLIYLGGLFHFCNWKIVLKVKQTYVGLLFKMVLFPIAFYYLASLTGADKAMIGTLTVLSALPTMTTVAMFAKSKDNEGEYAIGMVLVSTALCLITLPLVSFIVFHT